MIWLVLVMANGCATRPCPYRYRAPVLGSVNAPDLPGRGPHTSICADDASAPVATAAPVAAAAPEGAVVNEHGDWYYSERGQLREHQHAPVAYAVVQMQSAPPSTRVMLASWNDGSAAPAHEFVNSHLTVTCQRGAEVLKTWSGHARWAGDLPAIHIGQAQGGPIEWQGSSVTSVNLNTTAEGNGGEPLEVWVQPHECTVVLELVSLSVAFGTGQGAGSGEPGGSGTTARVPPAASKPAPAKAGHTAPAGKASSSAPGAQGNGARIRDTAGTDSQQAGAARGTRDDAAAAHGAGRGATGTKSGAGTSDSGTRRGVPDGSASPSWTQQGTSTAVHGGRTPGANGRDGGSAAGTPGSTGHVSSTGRKDGPIDLPPEIAHVFDVVFIIAQASIVGVSSKLAGKVVGGMGLRAVRKELAREAEHVIASTIKEARRKLDADAAYRALSPERKQVVLAEAEHAIEQEFYKRVRSHAAGEAARNEGLAARSASGKVDEHNRTLARENAKGYRTVEQAAVDNGGLVVAKAGAQATGQLHHAISRKIWNKLEDHKVLRGVYQVRDSRLAVRAADPASHRGYQTWHRRLDEEVVNWLEFNKTATQAEFEAYLRSLYKRLELVERFPGGLP